MYEQTVSGPLTAMHREKLQRLMTERGEIETLRTLGVSRTTMYRGAAGRPLYASSRIAIETALDGRR
jgi:hypothetical protein